VNGHRCISIAIAIAMTLLAFAKHRIAVATQEATEPKEIGFFLQYFPVHGTDAMYWF
jgi:hypothetical protein